MVGGSKSLVAVLCLLTAVGCGRRPAAVAERPAVAVTNVVEVTREVVVTNTVTVTNVVAGKRAPGRTLSARRTAPYRVSAAGLNAATLRTLISDSGARTIECENGAVALVEASDRAARAIRGVADVEAVSVGSKVAAGAGEHVRVIPLSTIDAAAVSQAVRSLGGEVVQVVTAGSPAVRARLSGAAVRELAERGDVRRIERDSKQ